MSIDISLSPGNTSFARRRLDDVLTTFDRKTSLSLFRLLHERVVLMEKIALAYALMDGDALSVSDLEPQVLIRLKDAVTDNTYHLMRQAQGRHEEVLSLLEDEAVRLWLQASAPVHSARGRSASPTAGSMRGDGGRTTGTGSPGGARGTSPRGSVGRSSVRGSPDGSPGRRNTLRLPAPTRLGRSSMATHDLPTNKGSLSTANKAAYVDGTAHLSYYQKQQVKYGKGRRGSTAVAGAWEQLFAEAEAASSVVGLSMAGGGEQGIPYEEGSVTGSAAGGSCASASSRVSLSGRTRAGSLTPASSLRLAQAPGATHALGPIGMSAIDKGLRRTGGSTQTTAAGSGTFSSSSSVMDTWASTSSGIAGGGGADEWAGEGRGGGKQVRSPTPGPNRTHVTP